MMPSDHVDQHHQRGIPAVFGAGNVEAPRECGNSARELREILRELREYQDGIFFAREKLRKVHEGIQID
jgi:hypothetical protein